MSVHRCEADSTSLTIDFRKSEPDKSYQTLLTALYGCFVCSHPIDFRPDQDRISGQAADLHRMPLANLGGAR